MQEKHPEVFAPGGAFVGGFQKVDDARYEVIRRAERHDQAAGPPSSKEKRGKMTLLIQY